MNDEIDIIVSADGSWYGVKKSLGDPEGVSFLPRDLFKKQGAVYYDQFERLSLDNKRLLKHLARALKTRICLLQEKKAAKTAVPIFWIDTDGTILPL